MQSNQLTQAIETAVDQAWSQWSNEHPSLASIIESITIKDKVAQNIKSTEEYQAAIEAYHKTKNQIDFINSLTNTALTIINSVL